MPLTEIFIVLGIIRNWLTRIFRCYHITDFTDDGQCLHNKYNKYECTIDQELTDAAA